MITPELLLKIILSSIIGYIALNSFFRYHFSSERFESIAIVLAMISLYILNENENINLIIIILGSIGLLYLVFFLFFVKKKRYGFFLLNTRSADYDILKQAIEETQKKHEMDETNIRYSQKAPYYIEICNTDYKKARAFCKSLDNWNNKRKKTFQMSIYWHVVAFLILMVAIWRF